MNEVHHSFMLARFKRIEKKQKKRKDFFSIVFSIFVGAGILFFIILLIIGNLKMTRQRAKLDSEIDSLKEKIQKLQEKKEFFQSQIFRARKEEEEYLEEKARDVFDFKKEGEKAVAVIFESDKQGLSGNQKDNTFSEKGSIWQKIFQRIRNFLVK